MTQQENKLKGDLLFYFLLTETWYTLLLIVKKYFNLQNTPQ